ncbi:MAG: copper amine oxidase N-terminal domain-containing protein, partial [Armatimonadetes bacterium]|nr:copper amine oxidase N-terminal domain-containing protein [Armatimonadota bacterium]
AVSVSAATIVIPRDTVIPVTMDKAISSATSRAGNVFYAHHTGINGGGFPEQTKFTGNVDSVTRASGKTAGQIGVSFVSAKLPDGTQVPILGQLTSLDNRSVTTDPSTGRLVGKIDARKANLKFAAIGAGVGLVLGQVVKKKPLIGTILGAAAGYLYGAKLAKPAAGKDAVVPAGTSFGILLTEDVTIPEPGSSASPTSYPVGPGWQVTFNNLQPMMSGNDLMVPFRSVMNSIDMPFDYNSATKNVSISDYEMQTLHTVGTRIIDVNGKNTKMDASSRIINGSLYVPASYIEMLTSRTAYWNQRSGVLRIE